MSNSNGEVPQDRSRNSDPSAVARSNSFTGEGKGRAQDGLSATTAAGKVGR
jgi:hypothetical protein